MLIVETRVFSRRIDDLLSHEEYRDLQLALERRPTAGIVIRGAGGLRKYRWTAPGRGKRGGLRVVYFWHRPSERLLMVYVFAKNERADLTSAQLRELRSIVEREFP